ncbi:MAG TPA: hypothetical protein VN682_17065 [Terriglobales bacterium]|nr:hypothetical protein [Terriglobales bacterium]
MSKKRTRGDAVADNASNASSSKHSFSASFSPDAQCQQMRVIESLVAGWFHQILLSIKFSFVALERGDDVDGTL